MHKRHYIFYLTTILFLFFPLLAFAGSATVKWNSNSESDLNGYNLYYGTSSRNYGPAVPVGKVTSYTVDGLAEGQTFYFAVTAVDTAGNESGYSQEVRKTIPEAPVQETDTMAPVIALTRPTTGTTYATQNSTVNLSGTASDNTGISQITWNNAQGGSGTASGTTDWVISGISLREGDNAITVKAEDAAGNAATVGVTVSYTPETAPAPDPGDAVMRINAGGPQVTANGVVWSADEHFGGGDVITTDVAIDATTADAIYQTQRTSSYFNYAIPLPEGTYQLRLHFAEIEDVTAAGERTFIADIEKQRLLENFDVVDEAGPYTALVKTFEVPVTDGNLNIVFRKQADFGVISAIEVLSSTGSALEPSTPAPAPVQDIESPQVQITSPTQDASYTTESATTDLSGSASDNVGVARVTWTSSSGGSGTASGTSGWSVSGIALVEGDNLLTVKAEDAAGNSATSELTVTYNKPVSSTPSQPAEPAPSGEALIRINSGGPEVTINGVVWSADEHYGGGSVVETDHEIDGTIADEIYQTQRQDSYFNYAIPLPEGNYQLRLHFAEIENITAAGERTFIADIEKQRLLENFDVVDEAGGPFTALVKTFEIPVTDGNLNIVFRKQADFAIISAIEVYPVP